MNPGVMRERIKLLEPVRDDGGWQETRFEPVAEVWAQVSPLRGRERVEQQATATKVDYRVRIRRRAITEAWRIEWRGVQMKILSIVPGEPLHTTIDMLCEIDRVE